MADIFFVDTTPFVDKYFTDFEHNYDWQGVLPRRKYITDTLEVINLIPLISKKFNFFCHHFDKYFDNHKALESGLRESTAKWKIVVGHHAIRSAGYHGETEELIQLMLPILKVINYQIVKTE